MVGNYFIQRSSPHHQRSESVKSSAGILESAIGIVKPRQGNCGIPIASQRIKKDFQGLLTHKNIRIQDQHKVSARSPKSDINRCSEPEISGILNQVNPPLPLRRQQFQFSRRPIIDNENLQFRI
jgi:hypothetical protein